MAGEKPILVLQMQRMGDLVLTFPLLLQLAALHPGRPLWVVAEQTFSKGLLPISPGAVYFPWNNMNALKKQDYHLVINLSHRPEAAQLAGAVRAEAKLGAVRDKAGNTYIHGRWQLYRASLVHNNRHNLFHWADLNSLDAVPLRSVAATPRPVPRAQGPGEGKVGLFLGASEPDKRPDIRFWAQLTRQLLRRGLRPLLLGGPRERDMGREVARRVGQPSLDLCGKFSVAEFVAMGSGLDLMVTPDTGPMHVAAWGGLSTLNLSMGPVNPWETGPYPPGHLVLRAAASCTGCWRCTRPSTLCHGPFQPPRVASLVKAVLQGRPEALGKLRMPGLRLFRTAKDGTGLYNLARVDAGPRPGPRNAVARFWQAWFGHCFGLWPARRPANLWRRLAEEHPRVRESMLQALAGLSRDLAEALRRDTGLDDAFWAGTKPALRPLTGHLHLMLQNADYSRDGFKDALAMLEEILSLDS